MSLQTGGRAIGATSTRSRSDSAASSRALPIGTMPTCSPSGPTRRTSGTRIRSLILGSELMGPPTVVLGPAGGPVPRNGNGPAALRAHGAVIRPVRPSRRGRHDETRREPRIVDRNPARPSCRRLGWEAQGFPLAHPRAERRLVAVTGYQRG